MYNKFDKRGTTQRAVVLFGRVIGPVIKGVMNMFSRFHLVSGCLGVASLGLLKIMAPAPLELAFVSLPLVIISAVGFTFAVAKYCGLNFSATSYDRVAFIASSLCIFLLLDYIFDLSLFSLFWDEKGAGLFVTIHFVALVLFLLYKRIKLVRKKYS
ncbi:hypothetical protein DU002_19240 [Corallincola holothuriorum]|uniref:Uncharacterized protein n=1 Tax=Corallincola holothuriorum TaxID=2282215 RepID=A0A368MYD1_9GAMM|nr:hypothetical protein [Corallincola holothuriorum]RCU42863.1 hypothetical protein DU002_19240 [Corallincola holothuriorum]